MPQTTVSTVSESLLTLPANWSLVPVQGKKPYQKKWTETNIDRLHCLQELESGAATGIGLKLGEGLLAIDVDGESAADLLKKLAGENSLADFSKTTAWTSGRKGRAQYLFTVAESEWPRIRYRKIHTGAIGDDGKEECLEFRWLGHQSVLPPSIHPLTEKPYEWINNPLQYPAVQAPEWLIEVCENWHPEYVSEGELDLVCFPARLYQFFRKPLAIWLLARRSDNSQKIYGGNKGCGIGSFHLSSAARLLGKDEPTILGLLRDAVKSGLLRIYKKRGDLITCYYTSFEKVFAIAGLEDIGPIAAINIDDLANIHILATEVEAQHLQRASFYRQRQEEIEQIKSQGLDPGKTPSSMVRPIDLHTCDYPARVLGKGDRFIYCSDDFRFYGGSQRAIADNRGLSASTVSRHLSNKYRLTASPVQKYRAELLPIVKKQLAERLPLLRGMPAKLCREDGLFSMHGDWWKPHCNVYLLDHRLVSARRRRSHIQASIDKRGLLSENTSPKILEDKFNLSIPSFLKKEEDPLRTNLIEKTGTRKSKIDHGSAVS